MKTSVVFVYVALALLVIALPASAANGFVGTALSIQPVFCYGSFGAVSLGWFTDQDGTGTPTTNGFDPLIDGGLWLAAFPEQMRFDLGPIPGADVGPINLDFRAPDSSEKRWIVSAQIQVNPSHIGGPFGLTAQFEQEYGPGNRALYIFEGCVSNANCEAYVAAGTNYLVKLTEANPSWNSSATQWTMPAPTSSLAYDEDLEEYVTVWSPNPTMNFTVYAPAVPEPSSIFAIVSGLAGFVGMSMRKRK